jgi:CubicO group peptidase (beta-lactamase class C family)
MLASALALVGFLVLQPSPPSAPLPRDIAPLLEPIRAKHAAPALAGAVIEGDRVVMLGATGVRAEGFPEKVTVNDLWHLGSCTKAMTATLCAILVEEGRLSWDSTVADAFPDLAARMDKAWAKATLRQLLTHRAGAPAEMPALVWSGLWQSNETPAKQRLALVAGVTSKPPVHEPGSTFEYSNAGYAIAGAMAERAAGVAFESLLQSRLLQPLGIASAGFGPPGIPGPRTQPRGHHDSDPVEPTHDADNPAAIAPAGTIHMTIADWAKFVSLHLGAHKDNPRRRLAILRPETWDLLFTPDGEYACGWGVMERPWGDGLVLTHSGSNTAWYCVAWMAPKKDFAVLVCCNTANVRACDDAAGALIREHLRKTTP